MIDGKEMTHLGHLENHVIHDPISQHASVACIFDKSFDTSIVGEKDLSLDAADQRSAKSKQAGIARLGEFLSKCDTMTILLGPTYLTRLWTTFELAG